MRDISFYPKHVYRVYVAVGMIYKHSRFDIFVEHQFPAIGNNFYTRNKQFQNVHIVANCTFIFHQ